MTLNTDCLPVWDATPTVADVLLVVHLETPSQADRTFSREIAKSMHSILEAEVPKRVQVLIIVTSEAIWSTELDSLCQSGARSWNQRVWTEQVGGQPSDLMQSRISQLDLSSYRRVVVTPASAGDEVGAGFLTQLHQIAMQAHRFKPTSSPVKITIPHQLVAERTPGSHFIELVSFDPAASDQWIYVFDEPLNVEEISKVCLSSAASVGKNELLLPDAHITIPSTPRRTLALLRSSPLPNTGEQVVRVASHANALDRWEDGVQDLFLSETPVAFYPVGAKFAIFAHRVGDELHVDSNLAEAFGKSCEICYYVYQGGRRIDHRWYSPETKADFKNLPARVIVRAFVRQGGDVIAQVDSGMS
ncbi:hypothetical protein [Gulosibacter sediminis]|uniref:hypothetical protein n=1 Tax=Gulosibacter sediminis TaxID=1729695 RepID=UPI001866183A|nr:hypothetical protein [Gulosibacter sediminis]